jgi:hypothetical protein
MMKSELHDEVSSDAQKPLEILVAGLARNCRITLLKSMRQLENLFGPDITLSYFLVESDSNDGTQKVLERQSRENPRFKYKSLGNLEPEIPDRIRRIAHCRNEYVSYLRDELSLGRKKDYLVVADFDGVNSKISFPGTIEELLCRDTIVSANQIGHYYDILALRAPSWVEEDYRLSMERDKSSGDPLSSFLNIVSRKQILISKSGTPIEVASAFGGLAIYPSHLLEGCSYEPKELSAGIVECEHVGFNARALRNGGRMIILPTLRNRGSFSHTLFAHRFPRYVVEKLMQFRVVNLYRKCARIIKRLMSKTPD